LNRKNMASLCYTYSLVPVLFGYRNGGATRG
jgi:hypothetical protein